MVKDGVISDHAQKIGARIVQARLEMGGMLQQELADLLHVNVRSMSSYESGAVIPYRKMKDLAAILNRSETWLLHGDEGQLEGVEVRGLLRQILEELKLLRMGGTSPPS